MPPPFNVGANPDQPVTRRELDQALRQLALPKVVSTIQRGGVAGYGVGHNDTVSLADNVDATHSLNLDWVAPNNLQTLTSMRLSFRLRAYRTYSTLSGLSVGNQSVLHNHSITADASGSSGHSHSHAHNLSLSAAVGGFSVAYATPSGPMQIGAGGPATDTSTVVADGTGESGHSHSHNHTGSSSTESANHTHTVSGASSLGIVEGAVATGVTVLFDGTDITAALGGGTGFTSDQTELNLIPALTALSPPVLPFTQGSLHAIALSSTGLGRIQSFLRLGYLADTRVT